MTCAKGRVYAVLTLANGLEYHGENLCDDPQSSCPRELHEGYAKCKSICMQRAGHAEEMAIAAALADGACLVGASMLVSYILLEDRWEFRPHICQNCQTICFFYGIHVQLI